MGYRMLGVALVIVGCGAGTGALEDPIESEGTRAGAPSEVSREVEEDMDPGAAGASSQGGKAAVHAVTVAAGSAGGAGCSEPTGGAAPAEATGGSSAVAPVAEEPPEDPDPCNCPLFGLARLCEVTTLTTEQVELTNAAARLGETADTSSDCEKIEVALPLPGHEPDNLSPIDLCLVAQLDADSLRYPIDCADPNIQEWDPKTASWHRCAGSPSLWDYALPALFGEGLHSGSTSMCL
jgi:hypothetical protein